MSLKYSKTAPPLAIFDDEKISPLTEDVVVSTKTQKIALKTNPVEIRKMAIQIAHKFAAAQKTYQKNIPIKVSARMLAGLSLQKSSQAIAVLKKSTSPTRVIQPVKIIAQTAPAKEFAVNLNPNLRDRVEEIENFDDILNEDYQADSFDNRAKEVLAQAGVDVNAPTEREIANTDGTGYGGTRKTYIQRMQDVANREPFGMKYQKFADSGYKRGKKPKTETSKTDSVEKGSDPLDEKSTDKGTTVASRGAKQVLIAGTLEMTKGLALTGNQKIVLYRQIGGTRYGDGQVFIEQGRYEIYVDDPNTGVIIAELLENESMVGRAEVLMPEVMLKAQTPQDLKNIPIRLEPIVDQVIAENISAYSYMKKEKIKNSQVKIGDVLTANTKIFNSSIVVKAMKEKHWGNIILGSSKQVFTNILSPDATIQALKEILGVTTPKEKMGIIKGEVLIAGKQVQGAQVEIIGAANEGLTPVYFNSFLPDVELKETSTNGQYAFVDIPEGNYLIRAKYKGKYLSPQVAPVEAGFVTQVHFDVQKPSLAEAFVFDIQTSEMMNATINFLGADQKVPVQARKLISFSGSEGVQFLEVQSQDQNYYTTRMTVDKSEKEILLPMISQSWLNDLLARLKVNSIPDAGLIIGTALELPYSVELDPNAYNEDTKIIYFDARGNLVAGAMQTPVGGGFVAINVNPGIRSLFNKYQGTKNLKISTMAVDSSAVNVFNSKF